MPRAGFEPTIPVFERAKMVHALDRAATVIDLMTKYHLYNFIRGEWHEMNACTVNRKLSKKLYS
jgi:hypothetical protein